MSTAARARPERGASAPNLTPPPGNPRFPLFDSMRAIAALSVFAGHTITGTFTLRQHPELFSLAVHLADQGVAVFFLISGFLLYRPFLTARRQGRPYSVRGYARRRILRIVPCYWAALTICLALGFVALHGGRWWVFYGFAQNYSFGTIGSGIGVAWTLCIEVTFYIALPAFAWLAGRLTRTRAAANADALLLVLLGAGALVFRARFASLADLGTLSTLPGFFFWFALGMGLAVASVHERSVVAMDRIGSTRPAWPLAAWAIAIALFAGLHEAPRLGLGSVATNLLQHALYGLAALFVLIPAVFEPPALGAVTSLLRRRALAWIGLVSYAFYLYHTIVIAQLDRLLSGLANGARYALVLALSLVVSLGCAAASYYVLERPLMRLGRSGREIRA